MDSHMTDRWESKGLLKAFRDDYGQRMQFRGKRPAGPLVRPSPLPVEEFYDSYVASTAAQFVGGFESEEPTCVFVGFPGPHEPWDAPGEYATMYDPADVPDPLPRPELGDSAPEHVRRRPDFQPSGLDPQRVRELRANYYGKCSLIDRCVGDILAAYEARGWLDELLVVFWSDHGEMAGDHDRLYKQTFHEGSVRVPLMLRWPGRVPAGRTDEALADVVDIFPTVLEAAGCEPSGRAQGRSLLSTARGEGAHRACQLSEIHNGGLTYMVRTHTGKYAMDGAGRGYMLYDLAADPDEQNNLIGQPGSEALEAEMREYLLRRLAADQVVL
jgi:choline-sulfatase